VFHHHAGGRAHLLGWRRRRANVVRIHCPSHADSAGQQADRSYGSSYLKASEAEKASGANFRTENTLISTGLYYQATKSLKLVGEFDYWWTKAKINGATPAGLVKNSQWAPAVGAMLFF
jgi:hypothetical protein